MTNLLDPNVDSRLDSTRIILTGHYALVAGDSFLSRWDRHNQRVLDDIQPSGERTRRPLSVGGAVAAALALDAVTAAYTIVDSGSPLRGAIAFVACLPLWIGGVLAIRRQPSGPRLALFYALLISTTVLAPLLIGGWFPRRGGHERAPTGGALIKLIAIVTGLSIGVGVAMMCLDRRRPSPESPPLTKRTTGSDVSRET